MFGLFKKWECVEAACGDWVDSKGRHWARTSYEIMYCKKTGEYKLKVGGHKPKEHGMYALMIERLNEYKTKHLNYVK